MAKQPSSHIGLTYLTYIIDKRGEHQWDDKALSGFWNSRSLMSWLGKMAKVIIYFSFLFFSGLTTQGWSMRKYHVTKCHKVTGLWVIVRWCHMTKSHGNHGKIVHRLCSSCISSIGNLTGTPSSSPCQLRLGVVLRCLSLSPYT